MGFQSWKKNKIKSLKRERGRTNLRLDNAQSGNNRLETVQ